MAAVVRQVVDSVEDWARGIARGWSSFWFTPQDPTTLGAIRILTGLMLLYTHAVWGLDLRSFLAPDAWTGAQAVRAFEAGSTMLSYLWYVPPDWLGVAHACAMIVLALFTIGLFTRVSSILSFIILLSYVNRAPAALFGLDQINGMLTLYLAIGPSGAALSADRVWQRYVAARRWLASGGSGELDLGPRPSGAANLAVRLIQVHMCVIYFFAASSKLLGPAWWDGTAIWLAASSYEYQSWDLTWLAFHPLLVNLMTHLCVLWELSFCALIWVRPLRPLVLLGAVLLHLGIGLFMGMITFGLIMLVGCVSFVPARAFRATFAALAGGRTPLTVVYDGLCGLCTRSAAWIAAFDVNRAVRFVDFNRVSPASVHPSLTRETCLGAMQVIDAERRVFAGYGGFRVLATRLRALWPVAWVFFLPGASAIGPRLYRWVASHRPRAACASGTCGLPTASGAAARRSTVPQRGNASPTDAMRKK